MILDLEPCVHCGNTVAAFCEELYKVNKSGHDHWAYLRCCKCGAISQGHGNTKDSAERSAIRAWGRHYRLTCKNVSRDRRWLMCSNCGAFTKVTNATSEIPAKRCGNCGAVVETNSNALQPMA